mgnify:CR=1 FL=1
MHSDPGTVSPVLHTAFSADVSSQAYRIGAPVIIPPGVGAGLHFTAMNSADDDKLASGTEAQDRLLRWATAASVTTACLLVGSKLFAWFITDAVSLLASLLDSVLDALASLVTLVAVRFSLRPADREHRFGHGKAEALAALFQAALLLGSCAFIAREAIDRFAHPRDLDAIGAAMGVMLLAIVVTLALTTFQAFVIRRTQSPAIRADRVHYQADMLSNGATLLALGLSYLGIPLADPILALAIALWLLVSTREVLSEAVDQLLDRELPDEERSRICSAAEGTEGVLGVHGLRTRRSGRTRLIQLHVEMDGGLSLIQAEVIADAVRSAILIRFPGADVLVHKDPRPRSNG